MINGIVAIVGRPNVGKSTIFNRLIQERKAIVDDKPGVTRDRLYAKASWLTKEFRIIDTGGIQLEDQPFQIEIKAQVDIAINEADVILFIVNGKEGLTNDDHYIAKLLQKTNKPIILAVNMIDDIVKINEIYQFYKLGLDDPIATSGIHGIGTGDILNKIIEAFPDKKYQDYQGMIKFSLIGRPNVGKSSIVNALLNQDRVIVSPIEGTTRDAIDTVFKHDNNHYVIIDTAGIKKRGQIFENIDKYALLRAKSAIDRSDIVLFIIDGDIGILEQDKHVAGYAYEAGKSIIIIYNKWDLVDKDDKTNIIIERKIKEQFKYLNFAPIIFTSAITKKRINSIIPLVNKVYNYTKLRIATNILNEVILDAQLVTPAPTINGKRCKIYYGSQVDIAPPTFVLFVNNKDLMHFSYIRHIENKLREAFIYEGTPIKILIRNKGV